MEFSEKHCSACRGDTPVISEVEIARYLKKVPGWNLAEGMIARTFVFNNFAEARAFFNKVADLAETEDHHPDMAIVKWRHVVLSLRSHAARGLTENDFIMAAKINAL